MLVRGVEGARGKGRRKGGEVEKVVVLDRMLWALRETFTVVSNAYHPINKNLSSIANRRH